MMMLALMAALSCLSVPRSIADGLLEPVPLLSELPEHLEIMVAGHRVQGWRGYPETIRDQQILPAEREGFVYRQKEGGRDEEFEVLAWSADGRAGKVLAAAEDQLIAVVRGLRAPDD